MMLASRSARAKHSAFLGKSHGIRNLPRSSTFLESYRVLCRLWFIFHHLRKKRRRSWNLRLKNPPSKHLVFEEPELDKQELSKMEVGKPRVEKQEVEFDLTSSEDDSSYFLGSNAFTISLSSATSGEIPEVETVLKLKVISSDCWNNNCILITLGGCLEQLSHSTLIGHRNYGWRSSSRLNSSILCFECLRLRPFRFGFVDGFGFEE
nr:hypothetical protein [Tanacetum cinerariifolium]